MKKIILIIYALCFIFPSLFGQDSIPKSYTLLAQKADSLLQIKAYKAAARNYVHAFKILDGKGKLRDKYRAARAFGFIGKQDTAFLYLEDLVGAGLYDYKGISKDSAFIEYHQNSRWKHIFQKVQQNYNEKYTEEYRILMKKMDSMVVIDQKWRKKLFKKDDSLYNQHINRMVHKTDSLNYFLLKKIVEKYGCPNKKEIDKEGLNNFWLLIQHQDQHVKFQKKVLKLMQKEVEKNLFPKWSYAYLIDRVKVNANQKQIYGTQMTLNEDGTSYIPKPCVDPKNLDKRREKMQLGDEAGYIKIMNENYSTTLKKKNN